MALLGFVLKGQNANSQLPQSLKAASFGMLGVCLGIAIYGVFTGIGLLRLKDWARFSVLVWAGITVFLSTVGILVISFVPLPAQPNLSENAIIITRWIVISIYGLPLLVGIWWLTLFNRHSVTIQFLGESPNVSSEVSPKPRGPLPITVLAWIFVVWALMSLPWFFLLPQRMPVVFFGHLVYGAPGKMIYLFSCLFICCRRRRSSEPETMELRCSHRDASGLVSEWFDGVVESRSESRPAGSDARDG